MGSGDPGNLKAFLSPYLIKPATIGRSTGLKYRIIFLLILSKDNKRGLPVQLRERIEKGKRRSIVLIT